MENFLSPTRLLVYLVAALWAFPVQAQSPSDTDFLREILRQHTRAIGRVDLYRNLNSYIARGTMRQEGGEAQFSLYKREGRMRMELNDGSTESVIVFDGQVAWQWRAKPASEEVLRLDEKRTDWLAKESRFEGLLLVYENLGFKAEYMGLAAVDLSDFEAYQIRLTHRFREEQYDIFMNQVSLLEVQRNYRPAPGQPILETRFDDYRDVQGIKVPFYVENRMNGGWVSTVKLDEVELNAGILRLYFEHPRDRNVRDEVGSDTE